MWELAIPLRERFANAAVTIAVRRVVVLSIYDGVKVGWGEAAPYLEVTPDTADDVWNTLQRGSVLSPSAAAALDQAEADLHARRIGVPLWQSVGGSQRTIATSVAVGLDEDPVQRLSTTGAGAVKLKIRPGDDVKRVASVRAALPSTPIGVDANGSYRWGDRGALLELDGLGVDYIEQPFPADDLASHARLREEVVVGIAIDEAIDSTGAAIRAIEIGACDILVVKPARLGISASRAVHDIALAAGLRIKASGLLETEIGRAATLAVATLPAATHSDIAPSSWYLVGGVGGLEVMPHAASVTPSTHPGIGFTPDPEAFAPYVVREAAISLEAPHCP